jgi:YHS domain-containing protein
MNWFGKIVRFLFWLLIVSWSVALLKRFLAWMVREATRSEQKNEQVAGAGVDDGNAQNGLTARRLVRDPVCGMHVAEALAIPLREGGELLHFCSVECRDRYAKDAQRLAANA